MTTAAQTQVRARFRSDTGGVDAAPTWLANENTNITVDVSGGNSTLRVRLQVQENSATSSSQTWALRMQRNGTGGYSNLTTSTSFVKTDSAASSTTDNTALTVGRLTAGSGSFINGQYDNTGATSAQTITANNYTEFEYGITVVAADVSHGDTLDFRIYQAGTTALGTYTVTPRITVSKAVSVSASPTGVAGTGAAGTPTVAGKARVNATGIAGTGAAGTLTVDTPATVAVSWAEVEVASASTDVDVDVTGVAATGAAGTLTVQGKANVTLTGVAGTGAAGTPTVQGKANVTLTGVAGTGAAGTPTVQGKANVTLTGVAGTGAAGTPTVQGKANVTLDGVEATGQVGTLTASVEGNIDVSITGVEAIGAAGDLTVDIAETPVVSTQKDGDPDYWNLPWFQVEGESFTDRLRAKAVTALEQAMDAAEEAEPAKAKKAARKAAKSLQTYAKAAGALLSDDTVVALGQAAKQLNYTASQWDRSELLERVGDARLALLAYEAQQQDEEDALLALMLVA